VAAWPEISQRRTEGGNVKAVLVQPVAVQEKNPIFRVRLWAPPAKGGYAWLVDDWELTEATVDDVPASVTRAVRQDSVHRRRGHPDPDGARQYSGH
jgi:hypothetical protein